MTKEKIFFNQFLIVSFLWVIISFLWAVLGKSPLWALEISEVMITDVTPTSFAVVGLASEEAGANIELYHDEVGAYPVTSFGIISPPCPEEEMYSRARQNGILKVKVQGLTKDTTYYFKLVCFSMADHNYRVFYPSDNHLLQVKTEGEVCLSKDDGNKEIRMRNNLLRADFYLQDKITQADGSLVTAKIKGTSYPISAYIGEGAPSPGCGLDLFNLFDPNQRSTTEAQAKADIVFFHYKGIEPTAIRKFFLPSEHPDGEPISPVGVNQEITLSEGLNYISFQVDPQNSSELHDQLSGKYTELWAYQDGKWVDISDDQAHIFLPSQGYLITTKEAVTLTAIGGWRLDKIPLRKGVNIVGYRHEAPISVKEAMEPLIGKYRCIWGYGEGRWYSYDPTLPPVLNTLTEIRPGKSYYLDLKETGVSW